MLIAIRADASATMGVGHVMRCLALADALTESGAEVILLTRDLGVDVTKLVRNNQVALVVLPKPETRGEIEDAVPYAGWAQVSWRTDAEQCKAALSSRQPRWIVVDHYAFDARWHREMALGTGARIAAIDDLGDRLLAADVVIDQNPSDDHASKFAGRLAPSTRLFGGPRYALLSARYRQARPIEVKPRVVSIGIFMSGTDPTVLSPIALRACREQARFEGTIELVTTSGNRNVAALRELVDNWPATRLIVDLPHLADFFAAHDLQIGAGGGAAWERCCLGVPSVALTGADNQRAVLPELAKRGAALVLDQDASHDVVRIGEAVRDLVENHEERMCLAHNSRQLVDGLGSLRVALVLCGDELQVRPARAGDSERTHAWRNHPVTRSVSRNTAETTLADHERWLQGVLRDERRSLLVAHVGALDVGVVRFDRISDDEAEVSIYLDPALHGLGIGRNALLAAEQFVTHSRWAISKVVADVLETNRASQRLFATCGYEWSGQRWRKRLNTQ
jgi:UDP-2,4-diacetamido-2,4,6-trideoxy-beta-L-altropyranose hydrolase